MPPTNTRMCLARILGETRVVPEGGITTTVHSGIVQAGTVVARIEFRRPEETCTVDIKPGPMVVNAAGSLISANDADQAEPAAAPTYESEAGGSRPGRLTRPLEWGVRLYIREALNLPTSPISSPYLSVTQPARAASFFGIRQISPWPLSLEGVSYGFVPRVHAGRKHCRICQLGLRKSRRPRRRRCRRRCTEVR